MTEEEIKKLVESTIEKTQKSPLDLSRYRVVRQEFATSPDEVQITFNRGRMYINSYGLAQFPEEDYIQVLIDDETQSAVIKPSIKKKRDSFLWCGGVKKRKPRHISCLPLCYLIFKMMSWDWESRYRITGQIEDYGEERVIFLDLRSAVCFMRTASVEGADARVSTQMKMPQEWEKNFGMPYEDYSKRQDIRTFDDVSVFNVELLLNREKVAKMQTGDGANEESQ